MPCLNEADTLATCIKKAQHALREMADLLKKAGGVDDGYLALLQHQSGKTDDAIKAARDQVSKRLVIATQHFFDAFSISHDPRLGGHGCL